MADRTQQIPTQIRIGRGVRQKLADDVARLVGEGGGAARRVVALVDGPVASSYPDLIEDDWLRIDLPGGESCKSFATLEKVVRQMAEWQLDRKTIVVAIGGGAIGDLGGLAASLFLRGVDIIQVPTTLLSMLDSSVGGKTAINIPEGKNLVGSFCPARAMIADLDLVASLPREQLFSGLGEALKMGIGFNTELFELLESEVDRISAGDPDLLTRVVELCVEEKIRAVEEDPFETTGRRRCLNLGHTLAHALESISDYGIVHGHAVARGLHFVLEIAVAREVLASSEAGRCHQLLESYGFQNTPLPDRDQLLTYFSRDKKMESGTLHVVLPTAIGACRTFAVRPSELI